MVILLNFLRRNKQMLYKIKDWRDEKNYEYITDFSNEIFWAWEFLRRNAEYQKDWKKIYPKFINERDDFYKNSKEQNIQTPSYGHPKLEVNHRGFMAISKDATHKWKLFKGYFNPLNDIPSYPIFNGILPVILAGKIQGQMGFKDVVPDGKYAIVIDPELNIETQIEIAKHELLLYINKPKLEDGESVNLKEYYDDNTPTKKRTVKSKWKQYLRILDASFDIGNGSVKTKDVIDIIFTEEEKQRRSLKGTGFDSVYQEQRKQADKLTKNYYKTILGL